MFWVCCTSNNRFFFMNLRFCFVLIKVDVCSSAELAEFTVYHELTVFHELTDIYIFQTNFVHELTVLFHINQG